MPNKHSANSITNDTSDRRYFITTPHLVLALCRDPYDYILWSVVKLIAGETGSCTLSTDDLAKLCACSHGRVIASRARLAGVGLLSAEKQQPDNRSRPLWRLSVPDLWPDNVAWRQGVGANWQDLIAAVLRTRSSSCGDDEKSSSSPGDESSSCGDESSSCGDESSSCGDDATRDASLEKNVNTTRTREELDNRTPKDVWEIARQQLRLQMTKATYEAWVRDTILADYDFTVDGAPTFTLGVANAYARDWLALRLRPTIKRTLQSVIGHAANIAFIVQPASPL